MISHAFLVLGPPDSSLKWISYFNNIAYQVSDDIFSLTELEHCIIRAKMSYPSQFFSRFVLPNSHYTMALTQPDFRINFALNCGSTSNPPTVFVYRVDQLDRQLDAACRRYLESVTVAQQRNTLSIRLPRVCQWFADDFGSSQPELIAKIGPFLKAPSRQLLANVRSSSSPNRLDLNYFTIGYMPYSFECRQFSLEQESLDGDSKNQ